MPQIYKALQFDIEISDTPELTQQEATRWLLSALVNYCNFNGQGVRIRKKKEKPKTVIERELKKHYHFEIEILAPPNLTDEDIVNKLTDALYEYCEFEEAIITKIASHNSVVVDFDEPAES